MMVAQIAQYGVQPSYIMFYRQHQRNPHLFPGEVGYFTSNFIRYLLTHAHTIQIKIQYQAVMQSNFYIRL